MAGFIEVYRRIAGCAEAVSLLAEMTVIVRELRS